MSSATPLRYRLLPALLLGLLLAAPRLATGQTVADVIAYDGLLELDGVPVENGLAMRFVLANGVTELWRSERSDGPDSSCAQPCQVDFYRGRFSVLLGEHVPLPESVFFYESVDLRIEVRGADGLWRVLGGAQTIEPAPLALWSEDASHLEGETVVVIGDVESNGRIGVESLASSGRIESTNGSLAAQHLAISGAVTSTSAASTGPLATDSDLDLGDNALRLTASDASADGVALAEDASGGLVVNASNAYAGGVRMVDGYVSGTATVNGNVTLESGTLQMGSGAVIDSDRALFLMRVVSGGNADTHISTSDYNCWVGGWTMLGGDINEGGTATYPVRSYTYRNSGTWRVFTDLHSHNEHESCSTLVVCMQTDASSLGDWF